MNLFKKILILLIVAALTAGIYFLKNESVYKFDFNSLPSFLSEKISGVTKIFKSAARNPKDFFSSKIKETAVSGENFVQSVAQDAKKSAFGYFKEFAIEKINQIENKFGAGTEKDGAEEKNIEKKLTVKYSVKINKPAYFSVKGFSGGSGDIKYEIDWGDGGKESGNIRSDEVKIVSHSWKKEGDYLIKFKIASGDINNNDSEYPVTVLP
ncbi:PKD domain-containing protein [Candidatus Wolfebacteria bacterium]|nr:PKD domain-containing protein [Candidatus Wolfebacteria bacterium]